MPLVVRLLNRLSFQTRMLLIQVGIILAIVALISVTVVSVLSNLVEQQTGDRALSVARTVAIMPAVAAGFDSPNPSATIQPLAESIRQATGVGFIVISDRNMIRYSHPNPELVGRSLLDPPPTGNLPEDDARPLRGETVVALEDGSLGPSIRAKVPIYGPDGAIVGAVSVGILVERVQDVLASHLPEIGAAAAAALVLGILVAFLHARHVKAEILGLEPSEIAGLFEQREAMLHGIREGVVAVDRKGRVTIVNDEARRLLSLPEGVEGWPVNDVIPDSGLPRVLHSGAPEADQSTQVNGRWIVVSRVPVRARGTLVGAIATFRDQTELEELTLELQGTRSYADTLRAQAHEFANKLHTIVGLLELGWYDKAIAFIAQTTREQQEWLNELPTRIADPALAALLVGKASVASERGVAFSVSARSRLNPVNGMSDLLATIAGNLIENAFDAVEGQPRREVVVNVRERTGNIHLEVHDSGPGVPRSLMRRIFDTGFSTKSDGQPRGLGLALVKRLVVEHGGEVSVRNDNGAVFVVRVPRP